MNQLRGWLTEKLETGQDRISIKSVLSHMDEIEATQPDEVRELPRLLGTAEAAELLGVERTRIGKWLKAEPPVMIRPAVRLAAGPVWTLNQIQSMKETVEDRRRRKKKD